MTTTGHYLTIPGRTEGPDMLAATWRPAWETVPVRLSLSASISDIDADREHTDHTHGACRSISISGWTRTVRGREIGGGQNIDDLAAVLADPAAELALPRDDLADILDAWRAWHHASMTPGCDHQPDEWTCHGDRNEKARREARLMLDANARDLRRKNEPATTEAATLALEAAGRLEAAADAAAAAIPAIPCTTLNGWSVIGRLFGEHPYPRRGDECYVCGRCRWDEPADACPITGYRFGTAWLVRPVPDDVVDLLIRALRVPYRLP